LTILGSNLTILGSNLTILGSNLTILGSNLTILIVGAIIWKHLQRLFRKYAEKTT